MHPLVRLHPAEVSKRIWKKPDVLRLVVIARP